MGYLQIRSWRGPLKTQKTNGFCHR
jgi:hypothetical protein